MVREGYLTSNANAAWPFDEDDPSYSSDVVRLFADASVTIYPNEQDVAAIRSIKISADGSFEFMASKRTSSGTVSAKCSGRADKDRPYVLVRPEGAAWCAFVMDSFQILQSPKFSAAGPFYLSKSCMYARASRVESFTLVNGDVASQKITGDVRFEAGNNMYVGNDMSQAVYAYSSAMASEKNGVVLSAIAGAGAGRVPCDESNDCPDTVGNITPDAQGDVVIEGDGCYQISPYPDRNAVRIVGRCNACCQCKDYVEIGDRLGERSQVLAKVYNRLMTDLTTYNQYAQAFNDSLKVVSVDELLVRCVSMAQRTDAWPATAVHMDKSYSPYPTYGSIDRGMAVLSIKNASAADVSIDFEAYMAPQKLVIATVVWPNKASNAWSNVITDTIDCSNYAGVEGHGLVLPSGCGITINLYGATAFSQTPNSVSCAYGYVVFNWTENGEGKRLFKQFSSLQEMPGW